MTQTDEPLAHSADLSADKTNTPPLDYLSYVGYAIRRTAELADDADHQAMEIAISLHRLSHALARATETTAHRPEGWSLAGFRSMFMLWVLGPLRLPTWPRCST